VFFQDGAVYPKSQSTIFMLPEEGVPSAVTWTVRRWCLDCAAGPEEFHKRGHTGSWPVLGPDFQKIL